MKALRILSIVGFMFLAGVVFADMDSERFYTALNLKLSIAAYGVFDVGINSSMINRGADENGDGIIFDTRTLDIFTNEYLIANPNNGRYMIVYLSNNGEFEKSFSNGAKIFKLDYSNIKEQFISDFEYVRAKIFEGN